MEIKKSDYSAVTSSLVGVLKGKEISEKDYKIYLVKKYLDQKFLTLKKETKQDIMHIDHIGIAVKDAKAATETYSKILNAQPSKTEVVESEKVETVFFQTGESKVELLAPTSPDSVIAKYVDKKGEGLHHVAFEVDDIHTELDRLRKEGFTVLNDQPKDGADNKLVAFVHPKDNHGVLVELCQAKK